MALQIQFRLPLVPLPSAGASSIAFRCRDRSAVRKASGFRSSRAILRTPSISSTWGCAAPENGGIGLGHLIGNPLLTVLVVEQNLQQGIRLC